ncbi:MAG: VanZ family protein [Maricaulis maris]
MAARPDAGLRWGARIVLLTLLFLITNLALTPSLATPATMFGLDKLQHAVAFLVLMLVARISIVSWPLWVHALWLAAYGATIELLQAMGDGGRTASLADFLADLAGILLGVLAILFVRRVAKRP